ncbi:MAG: hypothetical protein WAU28_04990 [Candidatus Moraniibacteriota bacterium]
MENFNPIARKYASIDLSGRKALKNEQVREFPGFSEDLRDRFSAALIFDKDSEALLKQKVVSRVKEIGGKYGIKFLLAGEDYPLHSTVLEGKIEIPAVAGDKNSEEDDRISIIRETQNDTELQEELSKLAGIHITYKYLLLDKGSILLTGMDIPSEMLAARTALNKIYSKHDIAAIPLENILHISIARMEEIPREDQSETFQGYKEEMIKLRHEISSDPLDLKVSYISSDESYRFLTGNKADK